MKVGVCVYVCVCVHGKGWGNLELGVGNFGVLVSWHCNEINTPKTRHIVFPRLFSVKQKWICENLTVKSLHEFCSFFVSTLSLHQRSALGHNRSCENITSNFTQQFANHFFKRSDER